MDFLMFFVFITNVAASTEPGVAYQTDIDATINGSSGIITSPSYPENYPNNANYTWTLRTGNLKTTVSLNFLDFNITKYHHSSRCEDFLLVNEAEPCCYQAMKRCGYFKKLSLTVKGKIITISFVSDNLHNAKGFYMVWKVFMPEETSLGVTTLTPQNSKTSMTVPATYLSTTRTVKSSSTYKELSTGIAESSTMVYIPLSLENYDRALTTTNKRETLLMGNATTRKIPASELTESVSLQTSTISLQTSTISSDGQTHILKSSEIIYLAVGISVVELTLIALGIYIVKRRRAKTRSLAHGMINKDKMQPGSRNSVVSVGNVYESIPMEHFSNEEGILEENKVLYMDVPQNVYDKAFQHRPHVNVNANMYQLLSELKKKY